MPHIKIRGLDKETISQFSKELLERVAEVMGYPETHITLEQPVSQFFSSAGNVPAPVIEMFWIEPGIHIKQRVANVITSIVRRKTGITGTISIIYFDKSNQDLFINGQCLDRYTDRRETDS